ncbi:hypothetical protein [Alteromonas lipolytica]|uniref:Uncharacterized protein n=1 Tax=Alteromonas lipolytica TaxID=1856405 RepID=A0A1E8FKF4_9ALTE|nr:hypothetical protein [Alteromonas lipolytica]OFI36431.1 hypothetical protein BFC17_00695 [Alteromonas lipolytica]
MKAGDIIISRNEARGSKLVRRFTKSNWSHVAIATSSDTILEAVPTSDRKDEVRERSFADLLNESDQLVVFERPQPLTSEQNDRLKNFTKSNKSKSYTLLHAGLTMAGSFIWAVVVIFFVLSAVELFSINRELGATLSSYILALVCVACFFSIWAALTIWSFRTNMGVPTTEKLFSTTQFGRYLVRIKHEMFCSKLVALAEKEIEGDLSPKLPAPEECLPKHIFKTCQKLGWSSERYK